MSIVVSNKQKIHYELAGDKGPWMLLHTPHMIPMSAWKEAGYVKQLEQDFRLVMIEPLGQGLSDAPEDASHEAAAAAAWASQPVKRRLRSFERC